MALGENLRHVRRRIGRSQLDVAKDIGISNAALSNYETGYREPDLETLKQLAVYYGVTIDDLAGNDSLDRTELYDLVSIVKYGRIAFNGVEYILSDSQRQMLRKQITQVFERIDGKVPKASAEE